MNVSNWFFRFGVLAILIGIGLGMWMGKEHDFRLAPVHGHLNLLGFVLPFIFGLFYRGFPAIAGGLLPKLHFLLAVVGVVVMLPALAMLQLGDLTYVPFLMAGEFATAGGMLIFAFLVFRATGKAPAPAE